jgi:dolichyl-phosphate beta-glucosyltransferase
MKKFSIVTPTYNESDKISSSITQITHFMRAFTDSFEIIISDDGSKDNTVQIIENMKEDIPELILLKNPHKGKGATVWAGFDIAQGEFIYLADADLSAPIDEIKKLLVWIQENDFDIAIASREGHGSKRIDEPFYRHFMGRVFNLVVQVFALPGIQDSQCGFKLFNKKTAREIFSRLKIYGSEAPEIQDAYLGAFDVEVLYLAKKLGYKVKEVPVTWTYVKTSRLNPIKDSVKMALDVLKIRVNDLKGLYKLD